MTERLLSSTLIVSWFETNGKAYSIKMVPHLTTGPKNRAPSRPTLTSRITSERSPCQRTTSPFSVLPSSSRIRSIRSDCSGRTQTCSAPGHGQFTEGVYKMGFGSKHLALDSELVLNATFPDCGLHGESGIAISSAQSRRYIASRTGKGALIDTPSASVVVTDLILQILRPFIGIPSQGDLVEISDYASW
jgi:hypothetical protein